MRKRLLSILLTAIVCIAIVSCGGSDYESADDQSSYFTLDIESSSESELSEIGENSEISKSTESSSLSSYSSGSSYSSSTGKNESQQSSSSDNSTGKNSSITSKNYSAPPAPVASTPEKESHAVVSQPESVQPQQPQEQSQMVWIPTNGGTKYHTYAGCSNMKNPIQVTLSEATAQGFTPCKRCH